MDRDLRWFAMPVSVQISNIGSEVGRAIRYKEKKEDDKAARFCNKAIDLWLLSERDPKNAHRKGEFECAIDELKDYFLGDNIYGTTAQTLQRYYDAFLYRL